MRTDSQTHRQTAGSCWWWWWVSFWIAKRIARWHYSLVYSFWRAKGFSHYFFLVYYFYFFLAVFADRGCGLDTFRIIYGAEIYKNRRRTQTYYVHVRRGVQIWKNCFHWKMYVVKEIWHRTFRRSFLTEMKWQKSRLPFMVNQFNAAPFKLYLSA